MSDFRSRLEHELVQAAGRPRRVSYAGTPLPRPSTIAAGAVAVAVLASALLVGGLGAGTHRDEVAVRPKPTQADLANQALGTLLARGTPLKDDEKAAVTSRALTDYGVDLARARSITPPPGAERSWWVVMPTRDGSGSACLDVGHGAACGSAKLVATTGIAVSRIEHPGGGNSPYAPGGRAYFSGIVPSNVVSIAVLDPSRRVVKQVDVVAQTYRLDVATEDLGSIEYRDAGGRTTAFTRILG
jgi:hypothetical protein